MNLHHVGIVTRTLAEGKILFQNLGFSSVTPIYTDTRQQVRIQFFNSGSGVLIELVEPLGLESPVSNFLAKRGPGLHHLCYLVDDIEQACIEARERGGIITCRPLSTIVFQGRCIAFVYWRDGLVEFLERGDRG